MKEYKVVRAVSHSRLELTINSYAEKGWVAISITGVSDGENEMFYALLAKDKS